MPKVRRKPNLKRTEAKVMVIYAEGHRGSGSYIMYRVFKEGEMPNMASISYDRAMGLRGWDKRPVKSRAEARRIAEKIAKAARAKGWQVRFKQAM